MFPLLPGSKVCLRCPHYGPHRLPRNHLINQRRRMFPLLPGTKVYLRYLHYLPHRLPPNRLISQRICMFPLLPGTKVFPRHPHYRPHRLLPDCLISRSRNKPRLPLAMRMCPRLLSCRPYLKLDRNRRFSPRMLISSCKAPESSRSTSPLLRLGASWITMLSWKTRAFPAHMHK